MNTSGFGGAESGNANAASKRQYEYPHVVEIPQVREPISIDDFGIFPGQAMTYNLGPRLINHQEKQLDYYLERANETETTLGRLTLMYSGQLTLEFEDVNNSPQASIPPRVPESPPQGPPAELPKVKTCEHAESDCDCD